MTYKAPDGQAPSYLKDVIVPYQPQRTRALRSQSAGLRTVPRVSESRTGGRVFSFQAPYLTNQLPVWIRDVDSVMALKSKRKRF